MKILNEMQMLHLPLKLSHSAVAELFVVALVRDQQTGGSTGRPPQGRCGGAEDGAGHQGECGRHHQIRSTAQLNHNHGSVCLHIPYICGQKSLNAHSICFGEQSFNHLDAQK